VKIKVLQEVSRSGSMASLMLSHSGRGNRQMKRKLNLMTALVGLAMLATPLTAAAKDHHYDYSHAARVASSTHYVAPAVVTGHGAKTWLTPANGGGWHQRGWADANAYRHYGYNSGYAAPVYAAPVYAAPAYVTPAYGAAPYGGGYAVGGGCGAAQRVMNTYYRDRNTGHPAAAYDLLRQNQWATRSGCATGAPVGGGFLGGLGGLGRLGGYGGGYGAAPAYTNYGGYNGGYNGGYGQPYGGGSSILTPLIQQFVR
jgi:hypothetical protein